MFSRIVAFLLLATLTIFAAATATTTVTTSPSSQTSIPASQCGSDNMHCCDTVRASDDSEAQALLDQLGVVIDSAEQPLVGIHCTPINILGITQGSCNGQPVCCQNNSWSGLIVIACVPISVGS